eukprot:7674719-Pyramimonas_sp.AAC.1
MEKREEEIRNVDEVNSKVPPWHSDPNTAGYEVQPGVITITANLLNTDDRADIQPIIARGVA